MTPQDYSGPMSTVDDDRGFEPSPSSAPSSSDAGTSAGTVPSARFEQEIGGSSDVVGRSAPGRAFYEVSRPKDWIRAEGAAIPGSDTPPRLGSPIPLSAPADAQRPDIGGRQVIRGSMWFIVSVITGAALSFAFWGLATKVAPQHDIGLATAIWVSVMFVNYFTSMGLPIAVARYGSMQNRVFNSLFRWALVYTAITSLFGTIFFVLAAPAFVKDEILNSLWQWGKPFGGMLFFLLITGMSFAVLVEIRLVTMRKWRWVYGRVLAVSLIRIPLLFVPAIGQNPMGLVLLIAGAPALSGFIGVVGIRAGTLRTDRGHLFPLTGDLLPALKYASVNYMGMLAAQAPQFGLPIVVASNVSADEFAAFFLAWSITVVIFLIPHTIGQVVLSEGSRDVNIENQVRAGLRLSLGLMGLATILVTVGGGFATFVLGPKYYRTAELLPTLVAAGIPWAITSICLARARVEGDHLRTLTITSCFALFTLIPAGIMSARSGTQGAALAWLIGNILAASVAVFVTWWVKASAKSDLIVSSSR